MSKRIPMKKILRLVNEVQETLTNPDVNVEFLIRGRYGYDGGGDVGVEVAAEAPVPATGTVIDAKAGVDWSRHWTSIGVGEFVLRVSRSARQSTAPASETPVGQENDAPEEAFFNE